MELIVLGSSFFWLVSCLATARASAAITHRLFPTGYYSGLDTTHRPRIVNSYLQRLLLGGGDLPPFFFWGCLACFFFVIFYLLRLSWDIMPGTSMSGNVRIVWLNNVITKPSLLFRIEHKLTVALSFRVDCFGRTGGKRTRD